MVRKHRIYELYSELVKEYGDPIQYWPQWCAKEKSTREREEVIIGAILTQRTSWHNANIALQNLKNAGVLSIDKISDLANLDQLTELIRPAGFFQTKPKRLRVVCDYIKEQGGIQALLSGTAKKIRQELIRIKGIGPETADTILLYALSRAVFIVDEYTRRWIEKETLIGRSKSYEELQSFFESSLDKDFVLYQNLHALIIISQVGRKKGKMAIV